MIDRSIIGARLDDNYRDDDWYDYKWQIKNTIRSVDKLEKVLGRKIKIDAETMKVFKMAIPPHYLSLFDVDNLDKCPIFKQAVATDLEMKTMSNECIDPLSEKKDDVPSSIVHRYPDRVLLLATNVCSMYCRFCTRKRIVSDESKNINKREIEKGLDYIRENKSIRDVLISGGDPLLMSDDKLDWLLTKLRDIEHIEFIRIGSRIPAVMPQRITKGLIDVIKKHTPIWINVHFNHSIELNDDSVKALNMLADAGVPLNNQSVLLRGINDNLEEMKKLVHKLLVARVRPYYLYQGDLVAGTSHFRTSIKKGLEIIDGLVGYTTGLARPIFVVDAPGGGGKIPIHRDNIVEINGKIVKLRNYKGDIFEYIED